jgi:hypothetical protein
MPVSGVWTGKLDPHLPGRVRRLYDGATDHRGDEAPREDDDRRLWRNEHIRFRGSLGLLGGLTAFGGTFILSRRNNFTNAHQHRESLAKPE